MAGAPKGNTNALKHGLYAKHYTPEQRNELRRMAYNDLRHEINAARVIAADILQIHYRLMSGEPFDLDQLTKNVSSFFHAIDKVSLCAIRYSILTGTNANLNDSLADALSLLPAYTPDDTDPR